MSRVGLRFGKRAVGRPGERLIRREWSRGLALEGREVEARGEGVEVEPLVGLGERGATRYRGPRRRRPGLQPPRAARKLSHPPPRPTPPPATRPRRGARPRRRFPPRSPRPPQP